MPLPLPDLDTRRWADLAAEARALIPRYAPAWTDHNAHDPGITLVELFAWLVEQAIYRVNRVPEAHHLKFLQLIGFAPRPPLPARTYLSFGLQSGAAPRLLPAGTTVATPSLAGRALRFRTLAPLTVAAADIASVQSFDGARFVDLSRCWQEGLGLLPWGTDPRPGSAFYVGWDRELPAGTPVSLWLRFDGPGTDLGERERISAEAERQAKACGPSFPNLPGCGPGGDTPSTGPPAGTPFHHAARTEWEYHDGTSWRPLDPEAGQVTDETRSLTLDGPVVLTVAGAMGAVAVGEVGTPRFWVRCRLATDRPDAAPVLLDVATNAVEAEQASAVRSTLPLAPGVARPAAGGPVRLDLAVEEGVVTGLAVGGPTFDVPEVLVLRADSGSLEATLVHLGSSTGGPGQRVTLPAVPVAHGAADVWTAGGRGPQRWRRRPDLDSSGARDADVVVDASVGTVVFGDGGHGRVVPSASAIFAAYDQTDGADGNVAAGAGWTLAGADDDVNRVVLGVDPAVVATSLAGISNRAPATGGTAEEEPEHAAGRAVENLWAHERLLELCPPGQCQTLDQLDRRGVLALPAPARATTLLDVERLVLDVPGTAVARTRAWAGIDPHYPCLHAPGTVTVVVVPSLPAGRPQPTSGLLAAVARFLDLRRVICTRLVVVGPRYVEVGVQARIETTRGADSERVRADAVAALDVFLDPLRGGPVRRGWPFGRDVYRSEILQLLGGVSGVDHVAELELVAPHGDPGCGNVCVAPTWLATAGQHEIRTGGRG